ncbi:MAG: hypothetical protein MUC77_19440 [Chromatiaceae bacterium]|jgi:hypothetical protein|nr:hypothetical protein [Chromatiaceae bacterium]
MDSRRSALIAIGFFGVWMGILYAGADHPPPAGFLWLLPLVALCAVLVGWRLPTYAAWSRSLRPHRLLRVVRDGLAAGILVGLAVPLLPPAGAFALTSIGLGDVLVWLAVLAAVGTANAFAIYALASVFTERA